MKKLVLATAITAALSFNPVFADDDSDMMIYHVTITNATVNHKIAPPIIIAHEKGFQLFKLGDDTSPASMELATLAETGNPGPLANMLSMDSNVSAVVTGDALIHGGVPYTVEIHAPKNTLFSVAAMLASTNDAFTAAMNIKAPKSNKHTHAMGMTFDAGSEMNNEDCAYVPGPPCTGMSGNANAPGEGFISIHSGISGKAGIPAAMYDWRGPTSMISIHNDGKVQN